MQNISYSNIHAIIIKCVGQDVIAAMLLFLKFALSSVQKDTFSSFSQFIAVLTTYVLALFTSRLLDPCRITHALFLPQHPTLGCQTTMCPTLTQQASIPPSLPQQDLSQRLFSLAGKNASLLKQTVTGACTSAQGIVKGQACCLDMLYYSNYFLWFLLLKYYPWGLLSPDLPSKDC